MKALLFIFLFILTIVNASARHLPERAELKHQYRKIDIYAVNAKAVTTYYIPNHLGLGYNIYDGKIFFTVMVESNICSDQVYSLGSLHANYGVDKLDLSFITGHRLSNSITECLEGSGRSVIKFSLPYQVDSKDGIKRTEYRFQLANGKKQKFTFKEDIENKKVVIIKH